jgi:2'-hydroxyisoflavone reductase
MKILVLGGTRFLGRHFVELAVAAGHQLTLFNRGKTGAGLFPQLETIVGDRADEQALGALSGRRWDAVLDTCGYLPRVVRQSANALRDSADRYLFISSISVYAGFPLPGPDEDAPRAQLAAEQAEAMGPSDVMAHYGALKAGCEDVVLAAFAQRAAIVRPGLIVGPYDPSGRFTWWVQRLERGGQVLAPAAAEEPLQFIDARDLAIWLLRLCGGAGGVFNACGPVAPLNWGEFLGRGALALRSSIEPRWASAEFYRQHGVEPWSQVPMWAGPEEPGVCLSSIARATAAGLRCRPLEATVIATAQAFRGTATPDSVGITPEREAELLALLPR